MRKIRPSISAFALLVSAASAMGAGCGGSDDKDEIGPAGQSTHYTRELSAGEAKAVARPFGAAGTWTLTTGATVYTLSGPQQGFGGSLQASGNQMMFGPPSVPELNQPGLSEARRKQLAALVEGQRAPCGSSVGSYRSSQQGKTLTFKRLRDGCKARRVALSKPWTKRK